MIMLCYVIWRKRDFLVGPTSHKGPLKAENFLWLVAKEKEIENMKKKEKKKHEKESTCWLGDKGNYVE